MTASANLDAFKLPSGVKNLGEFIMSLDPVHPDAHKTVVKTDGMVEMFTLPIEQYLAFRAAYYRPHGDQRDHVHRVMSGKLKRVIQRFLPPHGTLILTEYEGRFELADGNGRSHLWSTLEQCMELPSHVQLLVYHCRDEVDYRGVYDCVDSPVSKKTSTDALATAMRRAGLAGCFTSSRMLGGKFKSVFQLATGKSGSKLTVDDMASKAKELKYGLMAVDSLPELINVPKQCPSFLLSAYVMLLNDPRNVYATAYAHAVHATFCSKDEVVDHGIQSVLDDIAQERGLSKGPGCLFGHSSGENVEHARKLIAHYEVFAVTAALAMQPTRRHKRKVA